MMDSPSRISLLFLSLFFLVGAFIFFPRHLAERAQVAQLAALLDAPAPRPLDLRTKSAACAVAGPLPDHACTPGSIFPDATVERICAAGYSKSVRRVSVKLKRAVFLEYGFSYPQPHGAFEADHLVPLELGGSNDIANLFPEAAAPTPGFREKDLVENYLHQEVCAGRVALDVAQGQIADDWTAVYRNLTPDQIEELKSQFRSWAQ